MTDKPDELAHIYRASPRERFRNLIVDQPEPDTLEWNLSNEPDETVPGAEALTVSESEQASESGGDEDEHLSEPATVSAGAEPGDQIANLTGISDASVDATAPRAATEGDSGWKDHMPRRPPRFLRKLRLIRSTPNSAASIWVTLKSTARTTAF